MKKLIYFSILFFYLSFNVYANDSCTSDEMNRLKELARNVEFQYDYEIVSIPVDDNYSYKTASYKITAHNLHDELKVKVKNDYNLKDELVFTKKEPIIENFMDGDSVKIEIIAHTANYCSGKILLTKTVSLPSFNVHFLKDECKEYPDFKYCSEFGYYGLTDLEFEKRLEIYKEELKKDDGKLDDSNLNIIEFIMEHLVLISISLIGGTLILILTFVIIKKIRKDRDLR